MKMALQERGVDWGGQTPAIGYTSAITLRQPQVSAAGEPGQQGIQGQLTLSACLELRSARGIVVLPSAEEHLSFLRDLKIEISADTRYEGVGFLDQHHFEMQTLHSLTGSFELIPSAVPRGYARSNAIEIRGRMRMPLDATTAPFRLHAFVEPGGELSAHYSLDWTLKTTGDLAFS